MPEGRPAIPRGLERDVLVEAGHRCAIPTCRATPVEIAHIEPWARVREHSFENLVALCPTCHARYGRGEIDRQSMLRYKANLSVLNSRYGDIEQRVLRVFAEHPEAGAIRLPGGFDLLVLYLLQDGLLAKTAQNSGAIIAGVPSWEAYAITSHGREFIDRWLAAEPLE